MSTLSLVMIVKNEEHSIEKCLKSVEGFVDEIIIVDTGSTDKTKEICAKYGAKIYDYKWCDDFSSARNFSLECSTSDWNLVLDADEYITNIDIEKIRSFISSGVKNIGLVKRINFFEQDNEVKKSSERISRLLPSDVRYEGAIHEQVNGRYIKVDVDIEIDHYGYMGTDKFERNIKLLEKEFLKNTNDSYLMYQLAKSYHNNKMYEDADKFFRMYYKLKNFDTDAFYDTAITLYIYNSIKLLDFENGLSLICNNFELLQDEADFHFACGIFFMEAILNDLNRYSQYYDNIEISYLNALEVGDSDTGVCGAGSYYASYNLGVFYEMNKQVEKATEYYSLSSSYGYGLAADRLRIISEGN